MTSPVAGPHRVPLLILIAALAPLAVALASQYWGGLQPCILCIYQRYPYGVAAALGLIGLCLTRHPAQLRLVVALAGIVFLVDAGIAFYHVGVEQHWWQGTAECGADLGSGLSIEELQKQILSTPVVRCDQVAWSLFGISMAGYNFIYATLCGIAALWAAARIGANRRVIA
jgi:disulfide bond formation protein DsbB